MYHPGNWLLRPLCSHPIRGCQIDFDNNFQLRFCINCCSKSHTYIFLSGDAIIVCVGVLSLSESLCVDTRSCTAFQSVLTPLIVFPLFHFLSVLKEKQVRNDKDDKMWYKRREMYTCMHGTIKHRNQSLYPTSKNTTALTRNCHWA